MIKRKKNCDASRKQKINTKTEKLIDLKWRRVNQFEERTIYLQPLIEPHTMSLLIHKERLQILVSA